MDVQTAAFRFSYPTATNPGPPATTSSIAWRPSVPKAASLLEMRTHPAAMFGAIVMAAVVPGRTVTGGKVRVEKSVVVLGPTGSSGTGSAAVVADSGAGASTVGPDGDSVHAVVSSTAAAVAIAQ